MSENGNCPIWGTTAKFAPNQGGDYYIVVSPRAGGKYFSESEKISITNWIIEQHKLGVDCPKITSVILDDIKKRKPLSVHIRADNLLRYLEQKSELIGSVVRFDAFVDIPENLEFLAWTSSEKISEV